MPKVKVPCLCSRSQPGIKVIMRELRGHLLHTVTFLVNNGRHRTTALYRFPQSIGQLYNGTAVYIEWKYMFVCDVFKWTLWGSVAELKCLQETSSGPQICMLTVSKMIKVFSWRCFLFAQWGKNQHHVRISVNYTCVWFTFRCIISRIFFDHQGPVFSSWRSGKKWTAF